MRLCCYRNKLRILGHCQLNLKAIILGGSRFQSLSCVLVAPMNIIFHHRDFSPKVYMYSMHPPFRDDKKKYVS